MHINGHSQGLIVGIPGLSRHGSLARPSPDNPTHQLSVHTLMGLTAFTVPQVWSVSYRARGSQASRLQPLLVPECGEKKRALVAETWVQIQEYHVYDLV